MLPVLSAAQMREADRRTIEEIGLPGAVLMENAGAAVAREIEARFPARRGLVVLCGKGNNGGDGFVVARRLLADAPRVFLLGRRDEVRGDARLHLQAFEHSGGTLVEVADEAAWPAVLEQLRCAPLVVDALLGTGLDRPPAGLLGLAIADLAGLSPARIVAVDLPSGVSSDRGDLPWASVHAGLTVSFAAHKAGHVLPPAAGRCGEVVVADIGIPPGLLVAELGLLERADVARLLPERAGASHKGDFGHLLVIAGSVGKSGAAALCGMAALRSGAGLVTVATAEPAVAAVAAVRPELMTEPLAATAGAVGPEAVERALELARARDAVVLGPGLGQQPGVREFVRAFVARCPKPLLIDADGLNALAGVPELLRRSLPTVITPHPGEMARLIGRTTPEVQAQRLAAARGLARATGVVVVLKGQATVLAEPGGRGAVNPTGNPGMATGGTGDVLAGMAGAFLALGGPAFEAAAGAVFLHGLAGDLAAARLGQEALVAGDLLEALPEAIRDARG
jgi:NAD(P)H-hydrate epimerase